jgi:hypothetical protein
MRQPFVICQFMCRGVKTVAVSDGFCDLFGYTDREQAYADMNLNMFKNVHPEDTAGFTHALLRFGTEGGRIELLYRNKKSDGTGYRVIRLVGEHVSEGNGVELAHLWFADEGDYHDTSDREYSQRVSRAVRKDNLENTVRYDYPTGLPNLSYFFELAEVARKLILDEGGQPALLYIDLCGTPSSRSSPASRTWTTRSTTCGASASDVCRQSVSPHKGPHRYGLRRYQALLWERMTRCGDGVAGTPRIRRRMRNNSMS